MQSQLWQTQLDGKHDLLGGKLIATWNASYNDLVRTNPDDRFMKGNIIGVNNDGRIFTSWDVPISNASISEGHVMYNNLHETKKSAALNLEHPFTISGNRQSIKAGYMGTFRDADFENRYLAPQANREGSSLPRGLSIEDYFNPDHFADGSLHYVQAGFGSGSGMSNYYLGDQKIHAAYLMGEFSFFKKLRAIVGARMEKTDMTVTTKQTLWTNGAPETTETPIVKKYTDWLPSATLIYSITPEFNLRGSFSKTLARPDFREMSVGEYYNVDDRMLIVNDGKLEKTKIDNYDLRAEWYPGAGEVVSIGYFHKKFTNPVELYARDDAGQQNFYQYTVNLEEATSDGFEVNVRKNFAFITPALRNLYILGNFTLIKANVKYNAQALRNPNGQNAENPDYDRDRPLQGLSPYVVNAGLQWDGDRIGAAVNYNRAGRKLRFAGEYAKYDEYENPRDVLDLQLSVKLLKKRNLELKLNASEILDQDIISYRNCGTDIKGVGNDEENTEPDKLYTNRESLGMDYNAGDWVMSRITKGVNLTIGASHKF